jgi:hypothetical protein
MFLLENNLIKTFGSIEDLSNQLTFSLCAYFNEELKTELKLEQKFAAKMCDSLHFQQSITFYHVI